MLLGIVAAPSIMVFFIGIHSFWLYLITQILNPVLDPYMPELTFLQCSAVLVLKSLVFYPKQTNDTKEETLLSKLLEKLLIVPLLLTGVALLINLVAA